MSQATGVKSLTDNSFEEAIRNGVTLVDFWAPWCGPCRMQGPILEKVASTIGSKASICKLNVDENREMAMKHGISGIPTLLLFKDGNLVKRYVGVQREDVLLSELNALTA